METRRTTAPLGRVRITAAHITEYHSAVTLLCDESPDLRVWLWQTDRIHRGKALGSRFRLTVDGVGIEAQRVFARPNKRGPGMFLVCTSTGGNARAWVLGCKVGREVFAAALVRVKASSKQRGLSIVEPSGPKRVTVEVQA